MASSLLNQLTSSTPLVSSRGKFWILPLLGSSIHFRRWLRISAVGGCVTPALGGGSDPINAFEMSLPLIKYSLCQTLDQC